MRTAWLTSLVIGLCFATACSSNSNSSNSSSNKPSAGINGIIDNYLVIKNALADDKADSAAAGGQTMIAAIGKVDTTQLSPEQKALFGKEKETLEQKADQITRSADKIAQQRELFSGMSQQLYHLVKGLGTTKTLYQDHCPMYNNNKGASWLSETEDIKNPYLGQSMPDCGTVEEQIK